MWKGNTFIYVQDFDFISETHKVNVLKLIGGNKV